MCATLKSRGRERKPRQGWPLIGPVRGWGRGGVLLCLVSLPLTLSSLAEVHRHRRHSPCSSLTCPADSTISARRWFRNCSGAVCFGATTRAKPCARTSSCRDQKPATFVLEGSFFV